MPMIDDIRNDLMEINDADNDEAEKLVTNGEASKKLTVVQKEASNNK